MRTFEELGLLVPSLTVLVDSELPPDFLLVRQELRVLGCQRIHQEGFLSDSPDSELVARAKSLFRTQEIGGVLRGLLSERVSVKSIGLILSALVSCGADTGESRIEAVRSSLREEITKGHESDDGTIQAAILAPELEPQSLP